MFNGKNKLVPKLEKEFKSGKLLPLCPEQLGGLSTPRLSCGILDGTGEDVLSGKSKVINHHGKNLTKKFLKGSKEVLNIAKKLRINKAILKRTSPCCGAGKTWQMKKSGDTYKNRLVNGNGVLAALLKESGIEVTNELG